jgi:hypothetical protein
MGSQPRVENFALILIKFLECVECLIKRILIKEFSLKAFVFTEKDAKYL